MPETAADVLSMIEEDGYEFIDLRFCDLPGQVQHFTVPVSQLTEDSFEVGFGFDGSSIRGFQSDVSTPFRTPTRRSNFTPSVFSSP